MSKTEYVRVSHGWSMFTAYRDPGENGWKIDFDKTDLWFNDSEVDAAVEFFTKLQKKVSK